MIINLPKAKTHFIDPISGACKNWVGVMPMGYRLYLQRYGAAYYRGNALYLRRFPPALNLMDGIVAGEGQGPARTIPSGGDGCWPRWTWSPWMSPSAGSSAWSGDTCAWPRKRRSGRRPL